MMLNKPWTIFLIHHSHTDIGYTDRQDKIIRCHYDFIRQAIDILNDLHDHGKKENRGFVWQCENFWQVKNFYSHAPENYQRDFEKYVRSGEIGLSGNYLNLTELINYDVLSSRLSEAKAYGEKIGVPVTSGMTADINGYSWGYADALADNGIRNLFSCVHTHHGMFPLYKKQMPFYWSSPQDRSVLVWNGDHYHLGNAFYLAPHAGASGMIDDEIRKISQSGMFLGAGEPECSEQEIEALSKRIERYLDNLEVEGYPYDFVPLMVSGCLTDNSGPNERVAERASVINDRFAGKLRLEMITLDRFFEHVRDHSHDIPVYSGDWPDWWADGVGSTPAAVKIFLDARRKYDLCKKLDPEGKLGNAASIASAEENLVLYAEHTWGYHSSISEPWDTYVNVLDHKKSAYAVNASSDVQSNLDLILRAKGEVTNSHDRLHRYKILNAHHMRCRMTAVALIEGWEYVEGSPVLPDTVFEVVNDGTGEALVSQTRRTSRGTEIEFQIDLEPHAERIVRVQHTREGKSLTIRNHAAVGAEGVSDILQPGGLQANEACVETDRLCILFDQSEGIASVFDKSDGSELLRADRLHAPFSGIYEVTDIRSSACDERRRMGRNRKAASTRRYTSQLKDIQVTENGNVYTAMRLDYQLEGTKLYQVFLKIYKGFPRIDASVRLHKNSVWEPENLYVALPFTAGENEIKWIDKTGCAMRPGIDQLPGSNSEFYLLQNGIVMEGNSKSLLIAVKDAPLVKFGTLKAGPIRLCDGNDTRLNRSEAYSWVMNNFWETNFKVDLGGFYEFAYSVILTGKLPAGDALTQCEAQNEGLISIYI